MIPRRRLMLSLPPALVALGAPLAAAQGVDTKPGRVTGRAFHPMARGAMIEVSPLDDRPENLRLAAEFRTELARAGLLLGDAKAPLRLSFDSEVRPVSAGASAQRPADGAVTRGPAGPGDPGTTIPDRPVPRGSDNVARRAAPALRYVINATLDEREGGRRLWQGNVRYDDAEGDRARLLARLVAPLMTAFGQTQKGRSFSLE